MRKLQGTLVAGLAMGAFFGVLGSVHAQAPYGQAPAYGQAPVPTYQAPVPAYQAPAPPYGQVPAPAQAPAYGQAPAPAYGQALAPVPSLAETPPPAAAPKATPSDDMSGAIGVGVGVIAGSSFITIAPAVSLRYWINDSLALSAGLVLKMDAVKNADTSWQLSPSAMILFSPKKVLSTRLLIGVGLAETTVKNPPADVAVTLSVPVFLGLEHYFTRWFAMGVAMQDDFLKYTSGTDSYEFTVSFNSANYVGSLFFYTD
jgi:hypothetical protein